MKSEKLFKTNVASVDIPSHQIHKTSGTIDGKEDIMVLAGRNKSTFLGVLALLIVFIAANALLFLYDPNMFIDIISVLFFVNLFILGFLIYWGRNLNSRFIIHEGKSTGSIADELTKQIVESKT